MSGPIFVSYARSDLAWLAPLADALRHEHVLFFDTYDLAVGESIPARVRAALEL